MKAWSLSLGLVCALLLSGAAPAHAAPQAVLQDDALLLSGNPAQVDEALADVKRLGFGRVRITANWNALTRDPNAASAPTGFDAADPAAYDQQQWAALDLAVMRAQAQGIDVMIDIAFWAPYWATADAPQSQGMRARTNIDPAHYAAFATAVARRYRGDFVVPRASADKPEPEQRQSLLDWPWPWSPTRPTPPPPPPATPLPQVSMYTIWNEPNISGFLMPQWRQQGNKRVPASPDRYRAMVAAAYPQIKAAAPHSMVLVGGLASTGSYATSGLTGGVPPLQFIRALACVDAQLRPIRTGSCAGFTRVPGDGWAHHPYSFAHAPERPSAAHRPNDALLGDTPRLARLLSQLASRGRFAPALRNLYFTEYGYFTSPVGSKPVYSERQQGEWLLRAHAYAARQPRVQMMAQFLLRDVSCAHTGQDACLPWSSGLRRADNTPKLSYQLLQQGIATHREGKTTRIIVRLPEAHDARSTRVVLRDRQGRLRRTVSLHARGARWFGADVRRLSAVVHTAQLQHQQQGQWTNGATTVVKTGVSRRTRRR